MIIIIMTTTNSITVIAIIITLTTNIMIGAKTPMTMDGKGDIILLLMIVCKGAVCEWWEAWGVDTKIVIYRHHVIIVTHNSGV